MWETLDLIWTSDSSVICILFNSLSVCLCTSPNHGLLKYQHWRWPDSSCSILKWFGDLTVVKPPEPCPACPRDWWESQTTCAAFYCGLLFYFLAGKKLSHPWNTHLSLNRKGDYIGYSMTCVSRSSCIWSFKSFCLKDLVSRGGTVYDTLAGPLINWNKFFKGNHKKPFPFPLLAMPCWWLHLNWAYPHSFTITAKYWALPSVTESLNWGRSTLMAQFEPFLHYIRMYCGIVWKRAKNNTGPGRTTKPATSYKSTRLMRKAKHV